MGYCFNGEELPLVKRKSDGRVYGVVGTQDAMMAVARSLYLAIENSDGKISLVSEQGNALFSIGFGQILLLAMREDGIYLTGKYGEKINYYIESACDADSILRDYDMINCAHNIMTGGNYRKAATAELENMEESSGSSSNFYSPDIKIKGDVSHAHYYKDVSHLQKVDVYRVLELYNVTNPCIQHAVKKLLCAGVRGAKGTERDLIEAIDSITRALDMIAED
jgi:hypothetical protein